MVGTWPPLTHPRHWKPCQFSGPWPLFLRGFVALPGVQHMSCILMHFALNAELSGSEWLALRQKSSMTACVSIGMHTPPPRLVLQRERERDRERFTKMSGKSKDKQLCVCPFWVEAAPAAKAGKVRWLLRGAKIDQNRFFFKGDILFDYCMS